MLSPQGSDIELAVQSTVPVSEVASLGAEAERAGFSRFLVPDHPGSAGDPFVLLARVAAVTNTIGLGTYVLNAGVREPWQVASAAATLEALCPGRLWLGVGAGHTPAEWDLAGRVQPAAAERVSRLEEFVEVATGLLRGKPITFCGKYFHLENAQLVRPLPSGGGIPLIIGGNGSRVLRLGGRAAQIVSITGFGRTLPDGHSHEVRWSHRAVNRTVCEIHKGAAGRGERPRIEALVQHFELTDDRLAAARRFVAESGTDLSVETALNTPFVFFGQPEHVAEQMRSWRRRLGITSYVVRPAAMRDAAHVAQLL